MTEVYRTLLTPMRLLVVLGQSVLLALGQIWSNLLRSVLTTLGIVIGVASVTVVIATLSGLRESVLGEFEAFGTNKVFVLPQRTETGPWSTADWRRLNFGPELFDELLEHAPSLATFTRVTSVQFRLRAGERSLMSGVIGVDPAWHRVENRGVIHGRPINELDNEQARLVCLIDERARDELQLDRDPTGAEIFIDGRRFQVIGIVEPEAAVFIGGGGRGGGQSVFIPYQTFLRIVGGFSFSYVIASANSPDVAEEAAGEVRFFLRVRRNIQPGDPEPFRVEIVERFVQQFNSLATAVTLVAAAVVGISLLVGGVGIMNIMLVSVSERTREIGLRKAVGARPAVILVQFLVEAVVLCLVGGLVGLAIGQGLTWVVAGIPEARLERAYVPAWAVVLSFGFCAVVGLVFGMFPAVKASRLDPIDALRHE